MVDQLTILGEAFGESQERISPERLKIYAADLVPLGRERLEVAFTRARRELKWFPKIAELIELAGSDGDGRPGAEEAWAVCPKSEDASVVWTEEAAEAFGVARRLLVEGDAIGARMAFRERYVALVEAARRSAKPVQWSASLGWDKSGRVGPLSAAVALGRIPLKYAMNLLAGEQQDELYLSLPAAIAAKELPGNIGNAVPGWPKVLAELAQSKSMSESLTKPQPDRKAIQQGAALKTQ